MYVPLTKKFKMIAIALIVFGAFAAIAEIAWRTRTPAAEKITDDYGKVFMDYGGKEVRLSQFRSAHVIVFMWASWCPYCATEIQNLATLKKQYGDKLEVIAVNRGETLTDAKAYTDALHIENGVHFFLDPNDALYKSVAGYAMPETLFIDSRGEIVLHQRGPLALVDLLAKMAALEK